MFSTVVILTLMVDGVFTLGRRLLGFEFGNGGDLSNDREGFQDAISFLAFEFGRHALLSKEGVVNPRDSTPKLKMVSSMLNYVTYKYVIIKDYRLGISYYLLAFSIILYMLFEIILNKGYLEVSVYLM